MNLYQNGICPIWFSRVPSTGYMARLQASDVPKWGSSKAYAQMSDRTRTQKSWRDNSWKPGNSIAAINRAERDLGESRGSEGRRRNG